MINSISTSPITFSAKPILRKWEIIVCSITIIGLLVLLGIYYKRKFDQIPFPIAKVEKDIILSRNPDWIPVVNKWQGISLSDQIWFLQVCELRKFDVPIESLYRVNQVAEILAKKASIESELAKIEEFAWIGSPGKEMLHFPKAIHLLPNLERIWLPHNKIATMPDLGKFQKLKTLNLQNNKLKMPPDLSKNPNLEWVNLSKNQFTEAPNLNHNRMLIYLWIDKNQLTVPPDFSKNEKLQVISIKNNQLTAVPNLSKNTKLESLYLDNNKITDAPVTRNNYNLQFLSMKTNPLSKTAKKRLKVLKKIHLGSCVNY